MFLDCLMSLHHTPTQISPTTSWPASRKVLTQASNPPLLSASSVLISSLRSPNPTPKNAGQETSIKFLRIILDSKKFHALPKKENQDNFGWSTLLATPSCCKSCFQYSANLNLRCSSFPKAALSSHLLPLASSVHSLEKKIEIVGTAFFFLTKAWYPIPLIFNYTQTPPASVGFGGFYRGQWFVSTWP